MEVIGRITSLKIPSNRYQTKLEIIEGDIGFLEKIESIDIASRLEIKIKDDSDIIIKDVNVWKIIDKRIGKIEIRRGEKQIGLLFEDAQGADITYHVVTKYLNEPLYEVKIQTRTAYPFKIFDDL